MQKRYKIILTVFLIVMVSVIGANAAWMNTPKPGTTDNPLVSQGYLDRILSIFKAEVQSDIQAQQLEYEQLHNQYKNLEKELSNLKTVVSDLNKNEAPIIPTPPTEPIPPPIAPADPTPPPKSNNSRATVIVDFAVVNFRSDNNTSSSVVEVVRKGDEIIALKFSDDWIQGTINNKTGWIASWLVKNKSGHQVAYVSSSVVNVRSGPGTNHSLVTQVRLGDIVRVVSEQGDWCKVILAHGKEAWIYKPLLTSL